mgnify:CR=1 FL=1|jgi:hypothetical protein
MLERTHTTALRSQPADGEAARVLRSVAIDSTLAISHTNEANLLFAANWYTHLERAGVSNYAMIATDDQAYDRLLLKLPQRVVRCPSAISGVVAHSQHLRYRSAGWTRLMFAVPKMVRWVVRMGLDVLWMDTDVVALRDPFPIISELLGGASSEQLGLLASVDGRVPGDNLSECAVSYTSDPQWGRSAGGWKLCGGLFYIRQSPGARAFLRAWERSLASPAAGAKNQPHFNQALRETNLPLRVLPCEKFPNGYRYASDAWRAAQRRPPVLVHNNWIKGHEAKMKRFRAWGMWLANDSALYELRK